MESCLLCLEINKNLVESIKTNSPQWLEYHVSELIEKHLWPVKSLLTPTTSGLCLPCWQELNSFHKFYMRIEEAHVNFGRFIKVGNETQILETVKRNDSYDDKEYITYSFLEPEIILDKQSKKEEIESISTIKTEPQDESLDDVPIEDTSLLQDTDSVLHDRDPLEKPINSKSLPLKSKKKIETRRSSNIISKGPKEEKREIKKETITSDSDNEYDNDALKQNESDSESNSDNNGNQLDSDSQLNAKNKKQKTNYKQRTNHKEYDQFIAKHFKDIICDLCKTDFNNFSALRQHFTVTHNKEGYVFCCNKKFFNRTRLVDHLHSHLNPDHFKCNECGRIMSDRLRLERHMLRFHLPEEEKKFPCTECGKFYATSYLLKSHNEAVHLKKFVKICYICGKTIASRADFELHMNKHMGVPAPDINCDICGLRLASERGLKRHKESQHPVGGKKEHPCPICPKVSPTLKALKKHINSMHEKGYDHKCNICEKAFKRADALREHMASHTGTALYTCPWCPKTFNSNGNMHAHRKRVHPKEWEEAKLKKYSDILPQPLKIAESSN